MVLAAHDVRDPGVEVVDRDREVVEDGAVRARDHRVVEVHVLEARLAADRRRATTVSPSSGTRSRTAPSRLGLAAEAALGAVPRLVGLDVLGRRLRAVGVPALEQLLERLAVALGALALEDRPLVPVELQPAQRVEDLLDVLRRRALAVGILDAQHELAAARRARAAS